MEILEYFEQSETSRKFWEARIAEGDWRAASYLAQQLRQEAFQGRYGPNGQIFLLTDGEKLVSFCTLVRQDEIADNTLFPWIGFVYTFPTYRGHRYSEALINHVCVVAKAGGHSRIYLTSEEEGLYEKYGFTFMGFRDTMDGHKTQVFYREL